MSAEILNLSDYWTPKQKLDAQKALEDHLHQEAIAIAAIAFPSVFGFVDPPSGYMAPTDDAS